MAQRIWLVDGWEDPWFEEQDSAHKVAFMYLVLGPNSRPSGLFVQSLKKMALALNTTPDHVEAVMADLIRDGKVERDPDRNLVWVVNACATNERIGMGPPVRKSISNDVQAHSESPLVDRFLNRYPTYGDPSPDPNPTLTQGLPNPPKHKHKQELPTKEPSTTGRPARERAPDELWDSLVAALDLAPDEITKQRRGKLNAAVKELRDVGATPAEVKRRARRYQREHPDWAFTEMALVGHWAALGGRKPVERLAVPDEPDTPRDPQALADGLAQVRSALAVRRNGGTP